MDSLWSIHEDRAFCGCGSLLAPLEACKVTGMQFLLNEYQTMNELMNKSMSEWKARRSGGEVFHRIL